MPEIYYCSTEKLSEYYEKGLELITKSRIEKAKKIKNEEGRLQNLGAGLLMRAVLGITDDKELKYNEHGKLFIEHGKFFNISHSGKYVVLAVSASEIGTDIEHISVLNERVMKRCFTDEEMAFVKENGQGFTMIWTLKEAVLKMIGTGLSVSPKTFSVLPICEKHSVFERKIRLFTTEIEDYILSVAYCGDESITINEFIPKDLINEI